MLIYKIFNDINDKLYIGQTTRSLNDRIHDYYNESKYPNSHRHRPISDAMNKYGFDNFHFEILEDNITDRETLDILEKEYIEKFDTCDPSKGYNLERGGNSAGKHSEETRRKIGDAQRGEKNHMYGKTGSDNPTSKAVIDLTTGLEYESAMEAARNLDLNFSHVCASCRGTRASTGGHIFRYLFGETNDFIDVPEKVANVKKFSDKNSVLPYFEQLLMPIPCQTIYDIEDDGLEYIM